MFYTTDCLFLTNQKVLIMKKQFIIATIFLFFTNLFLLNAFAESPVRKSIEARKVDLSHERDHNQKNTEMKHYQKSQSPQKTENQKKQDPSHIDESRHRQELEQAYKKQWDDVEKGNGDPRLVIGR